MVIGHGLVFMFKVIVHWVELHYDTLGSASLTSNAIQRLRGRRSDLTDQLLPSTLCTLCLRGGGGGGGWQGGESESKRERRSLRDHQDSCWRAAPCLVHLTGTD